MTTTSATRPTSIGAKGDAARPTRHRVVSADAHILEPPHIWTTWLPTDLQDRAPKLARDTAGGDGWLFAGATEVDPIGLTATPGMAWDQFRWTGVTYDEARPGCYDGTARLADMDTDGVDVEVLFPPQRTVGHFLGDEDDGFVRAGIDAYNQFLWEEFTAPDRTRLVGAAQLPSTGTADCIAALQRAVDRGFKTVVLSNWPSAEEELGGADEAFWAAAAEADIPVCIHINVISRAARIRNRRAAATSGSYLYRTQGGAGARAASNLAGVFAMVPRVVGQLIFTGVFERHPGLHVAMIETGVGWVPHFLEQMDDRFWRNRSWTDLPIADPPSTYWHANMSASFIRDDNGIRNRHEVGVRNMMWSTDYPHHGNDWPYSRKVIAETMASLPQSERDLIVAGNALRIFGLED